jgi:hypothetical protein
MGGVGRSADHDTCSRTRHEFERWGFEYEWKDHACKVVFGHASYTYFLCHNRRQLCLGPLLLVRLSLRNVQAQAVRVKVHLVARVLQNLGNIPGILKLPQINVRPALLDGVTNQLGRAGLTLCADNGGLLLLARFVDDEGGTLCFLLCDLLGLDGSGELG